MNPAREEQNFLDTIARSLGRPTPAGPPEREYAGPPGFYTAHNPSREELLNSFLENVRKLMANAVFVSNTEQLLAQINFWLGENKCGSVVLTENPLLNLLEDNCNKSGLTTVVWDPSRPRQEMLEAVAGADAGIVFADYGVAATGSLALFSKAQQGRSVSLLPPVLVGIVPVDRLVPRPGEVFAQFSSLDPKPSAINFITGPSRTADIEMDLSMGVHGPGKVYIAVLDS